MRAQDHGYDHGGRASPLGERHRKRLAVSFGLILVFFVVEAVAGVLTNSLALLSGAGHMLAHVVGSGMVLAATQCATRYSRRDGKGQHTFRLHRLGILAALVSALLLFGMVVYVLVEAARRVTSEPEILGFPMLVVAVIGLAVNLVAFVLLREGSKESLGVEGAPREVVAGTVGSVAAIMAAVLLELFGWTWVDPVVGAVIGLWILPRTWRLGSHAFRILLRASPRGTELADLSADFRVGPENQLARDELEC